MLMPKPESTVIMSTNPHPAVESDRSSAGQSRLGDVVGEVALEGLKSESPS